LARSSDDYRHPKISHALCTRPKTEIHQKIVKDAARRVRAEGITGAAVSSVMRDASLTHEGFYKHFQSKDKLLLESLGEAFEEIAGRLEKVAWSF
jgi:TetR/AcrR family transcriptional repressor of nem operon